MSSKLHNEVHTRAAQERAKRSEPKWVYVQVEGGRALAEVVEVISAGAVLRIPYWKGKAFTFTLPMEVFRECPIHS